MPPSLLDFLSSFAVKLFVAGVVLSVISGTWFLFASYACDPDLARWARFRPLNTIRLVVSYPERCLVPCLLQCVAFLMCLPLFVGFLRLFASWCTGVP
jgi:hypothetical protein